VANIVEIVIRGIDKTKDGFTGPIKNLGDLEAKLAKVQPVLIALAATAAAAFASMVTHQINVADETGKMAQKVGVATEALSTMRFAAGLSDVTNETLATSFKKLSQEVVNGSTALNQLGVQTTDAGGKFRDNDQIMLDVADRFSRMEDGAQKSALAVQLFGRSGLEMIPFLNQGRAGIEALQEKARALGLEISGATAAAAEEFNDNLFRLKMSAVGVANKVAAELLPTLAKLSQVFVKNAEDANAAADSCGTLTTIFQILGTAALSTWLALKQIANLIDGVLFAAFDSLMIGIKAGVSVLDGFAGAAVKAREALGDFFGDWTNLISLAASIARGDIIGAWQKISEPVKKSADALAGAIGDSFDAASTAAQAQLDNLRNYGKITWAEMQKDADAWGQQMVAIWSGFPVLLPPRKKTPPEKDDPDKVAKEIAALKRISDLRAELTAEGLRGTAALMAQEDLRYGKQLEQVEKSAQDYEQYIALREQAESNHQLKISEISETASQKILDDQRKTFSAVSELESKLRSEHARGVEQEITRENEAYRQRVEQIAQLNIEEEKSIELGNQAFEVHQQNLVDIETKATDQRTELRNQVDLATADSYAAIRIQADISHSERLKQIEKLNLSEIQSADMVAASMQKRARDLSEIQIAISGHLSSTLGNMAEAAKAFGKKGAAAYKAFASAQAIVNTYSSAVAAYNAMAGIPVVGPALAVVAAAAAIAAGLANVAKINSTNVAHGGLDYVPSEQTYLLDRGERVLSPRQNLDLTRFLQSAGGLLPGSVHAGSESVHASTDISADTHATESTERDRTSSSSTSTSTADRQIWRTFESTIAREIERLADISIVFNRAAASLSSSSSSTSVHDSASSVHTTEHAGVQMSLQSSLERILESTSAIVTGVRPPSIGQAKEGDSPRALTLVSTRSATESSAASTSTEPVGVAQISQPAAAASVPESGTHKSSTSSTSSTELASDKSQSSHASQSERDLSATSTSTDSIVSASVTRFLESAIALVTRESARTDSTQITREQLESFITSSSELVRVTTASATLSRSDALTTPFSRLATQLAPEAFAAPSGSSPIPAGTDRRSPPNNPQSASPNPQLVDLLTGRPAGSTGASADRDRDRNYQIDIHLDGQVLARGVGEMSRDGRLEIHARSII